MINAMAMAALHLSDPIYISVRMCVIIARACVCVCLCVYIYVMYVYNQRHGYGKLPTSDTPSTFLSEFV